MLVDPGSARMVDVAQPVYSLFKWNQHGKIREIALVATNLFYGPPLHALPILSRWLEWQLSLNVTALVLVAPLGPDIVPK